MMTHWHLIGGALVVLAGEPGPAPTDAGVSRAVETGRSCGGDAFSFAEVVTRGSARGPVHTVPDTLCADLEEPRRPAIGSLNVMIEPPGRRGARLPDGSAPAGALDLPGRGRP